MTDDVQTSPAATDEFRDDYIAIPDFAALVGTTIRGDTLYPAYRDGDVVLTEPLRRDDHVAIADLHMRDCVVQLSDGKMLIRQVVAQSNGRATLIAWSGPPMLDVEIVAAQPVVLVMRASMVGRLQSGSARFSQN